RLEEAIEWYQRNLDWIPDERYNLAAAHLALGRLELGIEDLLKALVLNLYVPTLLLEGRLPESSVRHSWGAQNEDWAEEYVDGNSDLWEGAPLRILALVWADPAVREACHELQALRRSLNLEKDRDKRGGLVDEIGLRERELLD